MWEYRRRWMVLVAGERKSKKISLMSFAGSWNLIQYFGAYSKLGMMNTYDNLKNHSSNQIDIYYILQHFPTFYTFLRILVLGKLRSHKRIIFLFHYHILIWSLFYKKNTPWDLDVLIYIFSDLVNRQGKKVLSRKTWMRMYPRYSF